MASALGMLLAGVAPLVGLSLRVPDAGSQVALIFSPSISPDQALGGLASIDARIVRSGGLDNVVVAYFERPVSWPEMRRLGVLLSLDPIVARAGEAGKGFAVVANEVKSRANQTAGATEEIAQQIAGMQSVTSEAAAQTLAAAHQNSAAAERLARLIGDLESEVNGFLAKIRAA